MLYLQIINTIVAIFIILFLWANWNTKKQLHEFGEDIKTRYRNQIIFREEMLENQRKILDIIEKNDTK